MKIIKIKLHTIARLCVHYVRVIISQRYFGSYWAIINEVNVRKHIYTNICVSVCLDIQLNWRALHMSLFVHWVRRLRIYTTYQAYWNWKMLCYGNGCGKAKVMRISRQSYPVQTKYRKQLKYLKFSNCLVNMITNNARWKREIKSRIAIAKTAFNTQNRLKFKQDESKVLTDMTLKLFGALNMCGLL